MSTDLEENNDKKSFKDLGVIDFLCESCERLGWLSPTPIQIKSIPPALQGSDIIGLAETGSGKTGAFAIPLIQNLLSNPQKLFALVLTPTRELAFQIKEQFEALGKAFQVACAVVVGGMPNEQQATELRKKPHFIIGTPGRILYHLKNTKDFTLRNIKYLVMDEADRILDLDFEEEVNTILNHLPQEKKVFLFSATMTNKVSKLQRVLLVDTVKVDVSNSQKSSKYQTVKSLKHHMLFIPHDLKLVYLAYLLHEIGKKASVIIFCMTRAITLETSLALRVLGFDNLPLYGGMDQNKRLGVLNNFKSKERRVMLATDVASRGLDIPNVDYVINYDCPLHPKDYVHRVGRTARAGKKGVAITLVDQYTVFSFIKIEKDLDLKIPVYENADEKDVRIFEDSVKEASEIAKQQAKQLDKKGEKKGKKRLNKNQSQNMAKRKR